MLETLIELWTHLSIDFITNLPSSKGYIRIVYNTILVITDYLIKYIMYTLIIKAVKVDKLIDIIVKHIIPFIGIL